MKPGGQPAGVKQPESIEFVPKRDLDQAQRELEQLRKQSERLQKENERLRRETERLRRELEAAWRASKRQAAPHSRGNPKANPKRPGRKPGRRYGRQACRPIPKRVDERITVALPERCSHCGGRVERESGEAQYQEEIVRRTIVRRFDIAVGRCCDCQRRVQGRHPLQTSDAWGVGNVQLGPEALTLAAILNKQMGLSLGHTRQVLSYGFGLEVSRGGLYRALARMAGRAASTYDGLVETARQAPVNGMDETGWKVGGRLQWLHVAVSAQVTVYAIGPGRGYEQSAVILGAEYDGFLIHDGWAPYYRFQFAFHQSCLAHLLKRCREMVQIASPAALVFPRAVEDLLETSLELRDRYQRGEVSERGLNIATGKLEAKLDRMLEARRRNPANRRLARHLEHELLGLFTFLHCPGLDATNNAAERAIRGMVIARKVWGGNRTWKGARTQQILASVLRTCWQQGKDAITRCVRLLRAPRAVTLDIVPDPEGTPG
ncbi:MAG: IS66 family transposase [Anaerolineales bacterium]|nr:IS66 family transposase [Anaerolineales bacterium]